MSGNDNGTSASDIITYIGVPLAVLGGKNQTVMLMRLALR